MNFRKINEELEKLLETSEKRAERVEDKRFKNAEKPFAKLDNGEELTDEDIKAIDKFNKNADLMDRRAVRKGNLSPYKAGVKTAFKGREEELAKLRAEYDAKNESSFDNGWGISEEKVECYKNFDKGIKDDIIVMFPTGEVSLNGKEIGKLELSKENKFEKAILDFLSDKLKDYELIMFGDDILYQDQQRYY